MSAETWGSTVGLGRKKQNSLPLRTTYDLLSYNWLSLCNLGYMVKTAFPEQTELKNYQEVWSGVWT